MKRRDLIRKLKEAGWWKVREGGNHTIYTNGIRTESISRQTEIKESVARAILKRNGLK